MADSISLACFALVGVAPWLVRNIEPELSTRMIKFSIFGTSLSSARATPATDITTIRIKLIKLTILVLFMINPLHFSQVTVSGFF